MPGTLDEPLERQFALRAAHDPAVFQRMYRHYLPRVYAYVAYRVGREMDVEDIVADLFAKVVRGLPTFEYRGGGSLTAWIFSITRNEIASFYRDEDDPQTAIPLDDLPEIHSDRPTPDQHLQASERFARLQAMVETLSPRRAEIVRLRFFGGLRNQEIAAVLELDERTIAAHLSRAIADLQQKYAGEIEDL